jgi:putative ABC transport system permease protein
MGYMVSLRTREMGVRMALGALPGNILRLVLSSGMLLIVIGTGLGLLGSLAIVRYLAHLLWGVSVLDPWTYAIVPICIVGLGLAACFSPARRATRVDPAVTLRAE